MTEDEVRECFNPAFELPYTNKPLDLDLGAGADAAKAEPKNIRADASRISVEPKLKNV